MDLALEFAASYEDDHAERLKCKLNGFDSSTVGSFYPLRHLNGKVKRLFQERQASLLLGG
jgi:hypothetical protein